MGLVTAAAVAENSVVGRDAELPWPGSPADRRQYRTRIADWPVTPGRRTSDSGRENLPGTVRFVPRRSEPEYDVGSVDHAGGIDDAVGAVDSPGGDRACVVRGAGIYDLFRPVIDRTFCDEFTLEERVRERS